MATEFTFSYESYSNDSSVTLTRRAIGVIMRSKVLRTELRKVSLESWIWKAESGKLNLESQVWKAEFGKLVLENKVWKA